MLCENRPEVFTSMSRLTGFPSQCFYDVILVPLPTWLLIALGLVIFPLAFRGPVYEKLHRTPYKKRWHRILNLVVYYFAIAVIILMESVEVARLAQINFGLGLVPFVYAGCVIAAAAHFTHNAWGRLRGWELGNIVFWLTSIAVSAAKIAALNKLPNEEQYRRENGPYGVSHQITDVTILAIFYAILLVLEVGLLFTKPWSKSSRAVTIDHSVGKA